MPQLIQKFWCYVCKSGSIDDFQTLIIQRFKVPLQCDFKAQWLAATSDSRRKIIRGKTNQRSISLAGDNITVWFWKEGILWHLHL